MTKPLSIIVDGLNHERVLDDMASQIPYVDQPVDRVFFVSGITALYAALVHRHGIDRKAAEIMAEDWAADIIDRERQIVARAAAHTKTIPHSRTGPLGSRKITRR